MSLKESFMPEDWAVVVGTPHMVATAVMMAGFSGLSGTAKEALSLGSSLAQATNSPSPLIREIAARDAVSAAQTALRARTASLDPKQFKEQLNNMAVDDARKAVDIISRQAPDEVTAYKQWLMDIANGVANAAKEGSFLGFGGERVSEGERQTLSLLSGALGVQAQNASA